MRRRDFVKAIIVSAAWPQLANAQHKPVLGIFLFGTPDTDDQLPFFRKGLHDLGYVEGGNITLEFRYAEGKSERFPAVAAELVRLQPNVLVVFGTDLAIAMKKATDTLPMVFISSGDPIDARLAQSLAHPGWNATGVTLVFDDIAPRRLQFLKECAPMTRRVGFLWNPLHVDHEYEQAKRAAAKLAVELVPLQVRSSGDVDVALHVATDKQIDALYVVTARVTLLHKAKILQFAAKSKVPLVGGVGEWAEGGGLLSYGADLRQVAVRTAAYVNKILKGAKPGDIPIEQPTNFGLVVNLRTAKQLNLVIPASIIAMADKVIEV